MRLAKCRTASTPEEWAQWESDNRGGAQQTEVVLACTGCKVARECATYALTFEPRGMVWAGVPVPEMPGTDYYKRALRRLERIADGDLKPW
ncbi:WhiB family transcriptional regulator [Nocardia terpenica]|uniref:WhiB family transcriptional regulator n=1 Tax=Nocardia terpenica TaxID=455432 RepID=UPI0009ED3915|nr:WhiB family transcriptional regulator [Nocardia terpenica]